MGSYSPSLKFRLKERFRRPVFYTKYYISEFINSLSPFQKTLLIFFASFVLLASYFLLSKKFSYSVSGIALLSSANLAVLKNILLVSIATSSLYVAIRKFLLEESHRIDVRRSKELEEDRPGLEPGKVQVFNLGRNPITLDYIRAHRLRYEEGEYIIDSISYSPQEIINSGSKSGSYDLDDGHYYIMIKLLDVMITLSNQEQVNKTTNLPPEFSFGVESIEGRMHGVSGGEDNLGDKLFALFQKYNRDPTPKDIVFTFDELKKKDINSLYNKGTYNWENWDI